MSTTVPQVGSPPPARIALNVAIGAALGLCVGVLMGIAAAPVVGTVVGALAALFATIFGVKDGDLSSFVRIGGFGALCVLGVVAGIYLRTHNSLGISVGQQVAEWETAGFPDSVARSIVLYKELGVLVSPAGQLTATTRAEKLAAQPSLTSTSLSAVSAEECASAAPTKYGDDPAKIVPSYGALGGRWAALAAALDGAPAATQKRVIHAAYDLACGSGR